ncbi:hypothetical protein SAMN02910384_03128 [Pseudobutyrivibrio sp. ACV-2]|nr:hypothetical protein SAMN02910384_03128 [Pseudobutyrivibrio sp. ACV-2]
MTAQLILIQLSQAKKSEETEDISITNNHAFRMSLNSNVFIPNNVSLTKRAELLGHSVETKLRHYSYAQIDAEDDTLSKLEGGCPSVVLKTS